MPPTIGLIEYGCGNIRSVKNALERIGVAKLQMIRSESELSIVDKLILPGVGAFDAGIESLKKQQLFLPLLNYLSDQNHKVLGICLGMQILCLDSEEGKQDGLGLVNARVNRIEQVQNLKIPHMGWNTVSFTRDDPLAEGLGQEKDFYFVHSYKVDPIHKEIELGRTVHGETFTAMFSKKNIWGVQFHPEKSQDAGLRLLSNFIRYA